MSKDKCTLDSVGSYKKNDQQFCGDLFGKMHHKDSLVPFCQSIAHTLSTKKYL